MQIIKLNEFYISQVEELEKLCFSMPWSHKVLLNEINNPACFYIAAVDGTNLLGYAGMQSVLDEGYINNIAINSLHRRQGIATTLVNEMILHSQALSLSFLTLEVRQCNESAIRLYDKLGFKRVGIRRDYYEKPRENALLMTLFFKGENTNDNNVR